MKRILAFALPALLWMVFPAYAGNIKCGIDTTGSGLINQISDCTAPVTPFPYGGVAPTLTVANSNLCPINVANCSLRQYRCDADTVTLHNAAPVYSDSTTCQAGCNWSAPCTSSGFVKTLTGSGTASICTDANVYARVNKRSDTLYTLELLDTSPSGGAHANCEPPTWINTFGEVGGWHVIDMVDFSSYLPASNGLDAWDVEVQFNVVALLHGVPDGNRFITVNSLGTASMSYWDANAGASIWGFNYSYTITIRNNNYTCPLSPSAQCSGGTAGSVSSGGYIDMTTMASLLLPCDMAGYGGSSVGVPPASYVVMAGNTATSVATGAIRYTTIGNTCQKETFYYDAFLNPQYSPSTTKSCQQVGTCNAEPVCPTGFGCDCTNGTAPTCPDNGTFAPTADQCQLTAASLCSAGYTYSTSAHGCLIAPTCTAGTFNPPTNLCETSVPITCSAAGYSYNTTSQKCEFTMTCPANTSWDNVLAKCRTATQICDAGFGYGMLPGLCDMPSTGPAGTSLNITRDKYEVAATYTCDPNDSLSGSTCTKTTTTTSTSTYAATAQTAYFCPWLSSAGGATSLPANPSCSADGSVASAVTPCSLCGGNCIAAGSCYMDSTYLSWQFNSNPVCPFGWVIHTGTTCSVGGTGAWSPTTCLFCGGACQSVYGACIAELSTQYSCPSGGTLSGTTCTQTTTATLTTTYLATVTCLAGTAYNSAIPICQAAPICNASGTLYNTALHRCAKSANGSLSTGTTYDSATGYGVYSPTCPSAGAQTALLCQLDPTFNCPTGMAPGVVSGANVTCQQVATCPSTPMLSTMDFTVSKCKIPGANLCPTTWGFSSTNDKCTHTPTCDGSTYDATNKKCCACKSANGCTSTVASPTVSDYSCSPSKCVDITAPGAQITGSGDMTYLQNDVKFNTQTGACSGQVFVFGGRPSTCRPQGWDTAGQDCCNGASTGVAGGICQTNEVLTTASVSIGLCHYVGDYCTNSWPMVGCVQMSKMYCCFDGKLGRIINEQGRTQLKRYKQAYCPAGNCGPYTAALAHTDTQFWNTSIVPDCGGLKVEEMQMLKWGKPNGIDLSEYFTDVVNSITAALPNIQTSLMQQVNDFYNHIKK